VIEGTVAPGFEGVREAFARCFDELGETGAGFCALADGRVVADLRGGLAPDGLVHLYSVSKPLAAFCVLLLADRGALALEDRVADHWPEFAQAGKEAVTVRQLLAHQAGLPALREPQPAEVLLDHERLAAVLAREAPWFAPGSGHAEHALFYGHLCGELVRRADGRTLGAFWREEVAGPWRLDVQIGLTGVELARAVDLEGELPSAEGGGLYELALGNPPGARDLAVVNGEAWRRAEVPAINAHGTARGVARFFEGVRAGGTLDGVRLASPATAAAMHAGELRARDELLEEEICWGLGVWVEPERSGDEREARGRWFGMGGIGGSLGMADPELGIAEAYVTRHMAGHDRAEAMDAALRDALNRR
jgi:CubicO group peptidase (beta-lactamase class C family)